MKSRHLTVVITLIALVEAACGGAATPAPTAATEIYYPNTGKFSPAGQGG
jgi:hypothetical protein